MQITRVHINKNFDIRQKWKYYSNDYLTEKEESYQQEHINAAIKLEIFSWNSLLIFQYQSLKNLIFFDNLSPQI